MRQIENSPMRCAVCVRVVQVLSKKRLGTQKDVVEGKHTNETAPRRSTFG